jgi:hypothetical protein
MVGWGVSLRLGAFLRSPPRALGKMGLEIFFIEGSAHDRVLSVTHI